jgi:hypothetical protein
MRKNPFNLEIPSAVTVVGVVGKLLYLGIEGKVRMIVLAPTKANKPLQITGHTERGQRVKIRFTPDQRPIKDKIRGRIKILAGMQIHVKKTTQIGQMVFHRLGGAAVSDAVVRVTVTPTEYGEFITLVF